MELKETPYASEDIFQGLLEQYPAMLAGGQISPEDPCRWLLISREMGVPDARDGGNQWFLDHLFIDHNGIPTFVEVKRSTDTRIRREVVGQMLEYAANATEYWNVSTLRQIYEKNRNFENPFTFDDTQTEEFWAKVSNHLRLGKVRLLFVADVIPKSLLRIIEFLNNQMLNTEILGLEIKQYLSEDHRQIFVPKIVGQTLQASDVKKAQKREWDQDSFLNEVETVGSIDLRNLAERLMKDAAALGCHIWFGKGSTHSSIVLIYDGPQASTQLISVYPWSKDVHCEIDFQYFTSPFDTIESQTLLKKMFEEALEISIPASKLKKRPTFLLEKLLDEKKYQKFLETLHFIIDRITHLTSEINQ